MILTLPFRPYHVHITITLTPAPSRLNHLYGHPAHTITIMLTSARLYHHYTKITITYHHEHCHKTSYTPYYHHTHITATLPTITTAGRGGNTMTHIHTYY